MVPSPRHATAWRCSPDASRPLPGGDRGRRRDLLAHGHGRRGLWAAAGAFEPAVRRQPSRGRRDDQCAFRGRAAGCVHRHAIVRAPARPRDGDGRHRRGERRPCWNCHRLRVAGVSGGGVRRRSGVRHARPRAQPARRLQRGRAPRRAAERAQRGLLGRRGGRPDPRGHVCRRPFLGALPLCRPGLAGTHTRCHRHLRAHAGCGRPATPARGPRRHLHLRVRALRRGRERDGRMDDLAPRVGRPQFERCRHGDVGLLACPGDGSTADHARARQGR